MLASQFAIPVLANPLPIVTYSMLNGESGSQTYYDDTYGGPGSSGNPTVSGSFLSGGLGQLTNGLFANGGRAEPATLPPKTPETAP